MVCATTRRRLMIGWLSIWVLTFWAVHEAQATLQCYDCHGTKSTADPRPVDTPFRNITTGGFPGNHRQHLSNGAMPKSCAPCHPGSQNYGSSHRDGMIKLS